MKILFVGDLHFKTSNVEYINVFIQNCIDVLKNNSVDVCVMGGDLLDTHERLHQIPYNKVIKFIDSVSSICKTYILVGNHDYENNQQFLSDKHWMNPLKKWHNVTIADKVILTEENFILCPYVPPGRFVEALNTIGEQWKTAKIIFAHQELKGCILGTTVSELGDAWDIKWPLIISGHIHKAHSPQKNIIYPGSVIQHNFGEENNITGVFLIDGDQTQRIPVDLPTMKTIESDVTDFEQIVKNLTLKDLDRIRIKCSGNIQDIKLLKKSKIYSDLPVNVKVSFTIKSDYVLNPIETERKNFNDLFKKYVTDNNLNLFYNFCMLNQSIDYMLQNI